MKQIVDKLNKIAKKIDESVEIPQTDLIIDSLDAITKAYGGTPNDSNLIVDKLEDIYNNIEPAVSGNIEITENGENINVAPYATATVNVSGGGTIPTLEATITNETGYTMAWGLTPSNESPSPHGYGVIYGGQIPNQETITEKYLYLQGDEENDYFVFLVFTNALHGDAAIYADDLVNCTFEEGAFLITDPSQPSSATITLRILR